MSKRELKIEPCPFCGMGTVENGEGLGEGSYHWRECIVCDYRSGNEDTPRDAIRAHNAIARRLDPARVLMVLGGMKGSMSWKTDAPWYRTEIPLLNRVMDKIRNMETK